MIHRWSLLVAAAFIVASLTTQANAAPHSFPHGHRGRDFDPLRRVGKVAPELMEYGSNFWWIGAFAVGSVGIPNSGLRTRLQVLDDYPGEGDEVSYWASETLTNNIWAQVGYVNTTYAGTNYQAAFYQVWDLSNQSNYIADGSTSVTTGFHDFAMFVQTGTTWVFTLDGYPFGTTDLGSAVANKPDDVDTQFEEGLSVATPFVPPAVAVPVAMETLQSGTWSPVSEAFLSNTAGISGVVGGLQDSTLAEDQMIIGGSAPYVDPYVDGGVLLWNGGTLEAGIDGGIDAEVVDAGASNAPPLVSITSPAANASVSGAVTIRASASSANGISSVAFYVQGTHECTTSVQPYFCLSNTAQWADGGSAGVVLEAVATDALGNWSQADVVVNMPPLTPPPGDGGSPDEGGTIEAGGGLDGGNSLDATLMPDSGGGPHSEAGALDAAQGSDATASSEGGANAGASSGSSGCQCEVTSKLVSPARSTPLALLGLLGLAAARRRTRGVAGSGLRRACVRRMKSLCLFLAVSSVPLALLACGGSTRATSDAGGEAEAPIDSGVVGPLDAAVDVAIDVGVEAAPTRDASAPAMLLYSGDGEGFYDDTWEWSGTAWTQLNVPQPDTADGGSLGRSNHAMAQLGNEVVLFGGTANPGQFDLGDTWTWNGIVWTQLHVAGPPARNGHVMATLGNKVVMYGGCTSPLTDTWTFDGTAWTQVAMTGPNPGNFRCGSAMAAVGGKLVIFGGVGANPDTWLFDGTAWTQSSATGPGMRAFFAMGTLGGKAVMFGGEQDANTYLADTWTFDGTGWTQLMITGPAQRFHHAMAPLGGVLVLFGGGGPAGGSVPWYGDTWTFDGTAWTMLSATGPVGRLVYTVASR